MRPPTPSSGRTREEELAEHNRGKQRRSASRDRANHTCRGGRKNGGGGRREGDSGGGGGGGASGAGVAKGAAEGATLVQQPGQLAAALAEATEGGGTAVWLRAPPRGQFWSNHRGSWSQLFFFCPADDAIM